MTNAPMARTWWRWSRRSIAAFVVMLAIGAGIGLLVNVVSPNPVYGIQLIADFFAIVVLLFIALVAPLRRLLPAALGLAVGVIAGVAVGMNLLRPDPAFAGTMTVRLAMPEIVDTSVGVACVVTREGALRAVSTAKGDGGLPLADGRTLSVLIGTEKQEPTATDRPLEIVVTVNRMQSDGTPLETRMITDATSTVSISNAGATGSMSFSGLVLHAQSELREPIDVAGTVSWDCQG